MRLGRGTNRKKAIDVSSYPDVNAQVRPIMMDTYGGIAPESWDELDATSGGDLENKIYSALLQDLRWRLANRHAGQSAVHGR